MSRRHGDEGVVKGNGMRDRSSIESRVRKRDRARAEGFGVSVMPADEGLMEEANVDGG